MPTVPNFDIPDSPPPPPRNSEKAAALAATTKKFEHFLDLKKQGIHFNERLQSSSSLRNPSLLPKLMDFAAISTLDSYKSALPEGIAVPSAWPDQSYAENLLRQNERNEKKRLAQRRELDFVPASKPAISSTADKSASGSNDARKSKFDKR
ncbi:meiotically up-regulated gene 151 -like [Lecanosticta acicola]|uniref:Meiotically up-regulated gene 151 -like n=1 Tax=Lecanosticta acicola TaxID=111012 RepID=A0AAI8YYV3_9PEZI|nr:meiotically up-regulated gene 151 -like [Lecanosticta acicola]